MLDRGLDGQTWDCRGSESISPGYRWILDIYPVFCCFTFGSWSIHHIAIECILSIELGKSCEVDSGVVCFARVAMGWLWSYDGGLEVHGSPLLLLWRRGGV